jgi:hypothetical protein
VHARKVSHGHSGSPVNGFPPLEMGRAYVCPK